YVDNPFGEPTRYEYDASNKLRRIIDPAQRISSFTVNGSGDLVRIIAPDNAVTTLSYDSAHRLLCFTDPRGQRTSYGYDPAGRICRLTTPVGGRTTYFYAPTSTAISAMGYVTQVLFNAFRNPTGIIDPTGRRTPYLWSANRPAGFIDGKGN